MWASIWNYIIQTEPDGPSTPFAAPVFVFDLMRTTILLCNIWVIGFAPFAISKARVLGQKARVLGSTLVYIGVFGTELEHFGDYVHWRLYFFFFASTMIAWGYWSMYKYENPAELRLS